MDQLRLLFKINSQNPYNKLAFIKIILNNYLKYPYNTKHDDFNHFMILIHQIYAKHYQILIKSNVTILNIP